MLPAFTDTHMHLEKIAAELMMVHLEEARTLDELFATVAATASNTPAGEWVQSFGDDNAWHEHQLAERRLPTRRELDRIVTDQPVFLLRGPDVAALNSQAIDELGPQILALTDVELDTETGLLQGSDIRLLQGDLRSPEPWRQLEILEAACRRLLRWGITAVVDPGLPARFAESWNLYTEARVQGRLPLRVELMNRLDYRLGFGDEFARIQTEQVVPLAGDDFLRAFGAKMILDGEFSNAWVRPGEANAVVPEQRYTTAEFDAVLNLCGERGWPFCIHVMGGGAIDFVVERIDNALAAGTYFAPYQISLAHVFLPSVQDLLDCRRLGIALSVQPLLAYVFEREMLEAWGELAQRSNPYATMRASGSGPLEGQTFFPASRCAAPSWQSRGDRETARCSARTRRFLPVQRSSSSPRRQAHTCAASIAAASRQASSPTSSPGPPTRCRPNLTIG